MYIYTHIHTQVLCHIYMYTHIHNNDTNMYDINDNNNMLRYVYVCI